MGELKDKVLVAAYNATDEEKASADFVCTGADDGNVLRLAWATAHHVHLTSGDFYFQRVLELENNDQQLFVGTGLTSFHREVGFDGPILRINPHLNPPTLEAG